MLRMRIGLPERDVKSIPCGLLSNCYQTPRGVYFYYPMAVINIVSSEKLRLPEPMKLDLESKWAAYRLCVFRTQIGRSWMWTAFIEDMEYFMCFDEGFFIWDVFTPDELKMLREMEQRKG